MRKLSVTDEAEVRAEFQRLYRDSGNEGLLILISELTIGIQVALEVLKEHAKES